MNALTPVSVAMVLAYVVGAALRPDDFARSYLVGYLFWLEISLGCLALALLHRLTGGRWGLAIGTPLRSGANTILPMAALFIPIALASRALFSWADPKSTDPLLLHQASYLNLPAFLARAVAYFAVWFALGAGRIPAAPGLLLWALAASFAGTDWVQSLDHHWVSTIFGMQFFVGHALGATAFAVFLTCRRTGTHARTLNDLGNILLVFTLLWSYLTFSQFLIMWEGNLPEEVAWYVQRSHGQWLVLACLMAIFQFAIPFFLLLFRRIKTDRRLLGALAGAILLARWLELCWTIGPGVHVNPGLTPMDLLSPLAIGAVWLALFRSAQRSYA